MSTQRQPGIGLSFAGLAILLAGSTPALAQTLDVHTDRGCGSQAVYQSGEITHISFSSSQTVNAQLTLAKPDGTTLTLANQRLTGGATYHISGRIGPPSGTRTLTLAAGSAAATCSYSVGAPSPPPPQTARVPGLLNLQGAQDPIVAPATVRVGEEFLVTITTFGDGCVEKGDEGVIVRDNGAAIFIYDDTTATQPDVVCTTIFKELRHTVTLRFNQPGEKVIQIWGRQAEADAPPGGTPLVLEQHVLVQ